ncbi:DUF3017 domain-containing protein [Streptomyces sp. ISL-99]|uniref:DUF3017 domain-containing protein n=1 Tax=Streptomyces sp. ISL-99 TaxID=2819193 RepID=UPI001BE536BE|nr:DUF3017 domain-containing protein [Streptomyces sp. ISL-99]MBT2529562.1 DUF3017 domain-containing protein [Streptomyces sp. ISL-99]
MGAATSPDEPATTGDVTVDAAAQDARAAQVAEDAQATDRTGAAGATGETAGTGEAGEPEPAAKGVVSAPGPEGPVRTTRRFPMFTRDTARPEGGGRAAPGDAAAPVRQWPFLVVLGTTGLGLLLVAVDAFGIGFRLGTLLIGLALISGAVLRRFIPSVGMLAVRSRFTDMATYGLLGFAIVLLALMAQPDPWLEIPLLESAVRFTVR